MPTFRHESVVPFPVDVVLAWHARPGALERLSPPWQRARVERREGARAYLSLRAGPTRRRWVALHREAPDGFVDVQEAGPFRRWMHHHRFVAEPGGHTRCIDEVEYELGAVASLASGYVTRALGRAFAYRHLQLARDLARHAQAPPTPLTIAVTGATGFLGSRLVPFLTSGGHTVRALRVRGRVEASELEGVDAVVHLAGETINQRWTKVAKARILDSRAVTTRSLAEAMASARDGPRVLVCASAIGAYGDRGDEELTEASPLGSGFLAGVVRAWEAACEPARAAGIRVVNARFGLVLAHEGGALHSLLLPFRLGAGGPVGPGTQWWSWVHVDDVVGALHRALHDACFEGPMNVVAPAPVPNREFVKALGRALHRPAIAPLPTPVVRAMFGEMGDLLLHSERVLPGALTRWGFEFAHPQLDDALAFELGAT